MKTSILLAFLLVTVFSNCQKLEPRPIGTQTVVTYDEYVAAAEFLGMPLSAFGIKRNWDEVLAIAAIYGVEDEFSDQERTNNSLMSMTEDELHTYFQEHQLMRGKMRQRQVYLEKGQHIQTLSEYFKLMDSLPLYRIMRYPSDEAYAALKKEYFASNYQFFINEAVLGPNNHIPPFLIAVTKPFQMPTEKARRIAKR